VDVRRDARLAVRPGSEADVVSIPVREDERPHVVEALADRGKFGPKPLSIGWIGMGRVLRPVHRRLGWATTLLGLACLVDSLGTAVNVDAIATAGLTIYLVLAPIWACWLGARLLRHRAPFAASARSHHPAGGTAWARRAADAAAATGGST
jgi:hypothetical protein